MKFNALKEKNNIINFIKEYYQKYDLGGAVIGISGGKDSAVVAALFVEALGSNNVIGLTLPCHSQEEDKIDAELISNYYGFKLHNFDLTNVFDSFKEELSNIGNYTNNQLTNSDINLKPRLRMSTLYYFAALYSNLNNKGYLVAGTSNKCELYVGYFTKGGDSVHDISVLSDFTVDEVIKLGEVLNVPNKVLYKTPSDGLSNSSDEDKLCVKYKDIATYIENPNELSKDIQNKITKLHNNNLHKFNIPTYSRK